MRIAPGDPERNLETALLSCSTADNQTYASAWTHRVLDTAAAWPDARSGQDTRVAVIDTGRSQHVELEGVCLPDADRHDVLVDVLGRQPAEVWPLFAVALSGEAIDRLVKGAAS